MDASKIARGIIEAYGGADLINAEMDDGTFDAATVERLIREGVQAVETERERIVEEGVTLTYAGYHDVWDAQKQKWVTRRRVGRPGGH